MTGIHLSAQELSLTTQDGNTYTGIIKKSFEDAVYLQNGDGVTMKFQFENLQADSKSQAESYLSENPARADVFAKVDVAPVPDQTQQPDIPRELKRESAKISVWIVVGEDGSVLLSEIHKSNNDKLDQVSLDCVNSWTFKPGEAGGSPVKCEMIIPFRYRGR